MEFSHVPVLAAECIEGLAVKPDGIDRKSTRLNSSH